MTTCPTRTTTDFPTVLIFGDFNCPFSAIASARAERIEHLGIGVVDWHAVEHAPAIAPAGEPVCCQVADDLGRELDQIRDLLTPSEPDLLRVPSVLPNTRAATSAYAATPPDQRSAVRQRLFAACWMDDTALSDEAVIDELVGTARDDDQVARWRASWQSLPQQLVPVMVLPDGYVSRGLGALARLAEAIDGTSARIHGH